MPLKYRGSGNQQEIDIILYGDGATSSTDINLSMAPFDIDFKGGLPSIAFLVGERSSSPSEYPDLTNISIIPGTPPSVGMLRLEFESPLPAVTYAQVDEVGAPSSAINLIIRFIYG